MVKNKINIKDDIEINGRIYFIPDKLIEHNHLGFEYIKLYKFILASVIDNNLEKNLIKNINQITKTILNNYIQSSDKIFSYVITGKINIINLSNIEANIIKKLPTTLIPKLNPNIVERLE